MCVCVFSRSPLKGVPGSARTPVPLKFSSPAAYCLSLSIENSVSTSASTPKGRC